MSLFSSLNYKDILKKTFEERKSALNDVSYQEMAQHCRVQKTYLSKVLNHDGNLNADQVFLACQYLNLNDEETQFVALTHQIQNCQIDQRKRALLKEVEKIQAQKLKTESHIRTQEVFTREQSLDDYYTDPLFVIIHMALTLETYQKDPLKLAAAISIGQDVLKTYLRKLEQMGVIEFKNSRYRIAKDNLHLSSDSPLYKAYRTMMRLKALEQMDRSEKDAFYSFSVVFSTSPKIRKLIQKKFLDLISEIQKEMAKEPETDVYQMNFDLVGWT